mgnify:CR=1 FL=1
MNKQLLDEFAKKFYEKYPFEQGKENGAELFELLSLLYNHKEQLLENKISSSTSTMKAEYEKSDREDTSKTIEPALRLFWNVAIRKFCYWEMPLQKWQ